MSPFLWAYIVFIVLVIVGLNMIFRRNRKSANQVDDSPNESLSRSRRRGRKQPGEDQVDEQPSMQTASRSEDETPLRSRSDLDKDVVSDSTNQPIRSSEPAGSEEHGSSEPTDETLPATSFEGQDPEQIKEESAKAERPGKKKRTKKPSKRSEIIDPSSVHPVSIVAVLILGAFTAILNQTLLNVALPKIQTDLNVSYNTVQWLVTGYMLVNGVLIPITAFLLETFTTRTLFIFAMSSFGIGTIFCAISPTFPILLVGRLIQGIGAGIIMPLMTNVMLTIFPPEKRGAAMGTMGVAMIFAPAVGPTLSGWIVENYSWRILFYVVLPITIIDIILAFVFLRNIRKLTHPKLDILGIILSTIGFGGVLYAFSEAGNDGWSSTKVDVALIAGVIALALFLWRSLTVKNPILEFRVFKFSIFSMTTIVNAVITMAMFAGMILTPIYLQNIRGFTPLQSGLLLLPGAILMGIMSPITGILYDKIGARPLAIVGLLITAVTTWNFGHLTDATTYGHIMVMYTFRMFGMSMLMMPIMTEGLNNLPPKYYSHGTAMSNTMRQVAGSLGTAFLVTVMSNRTTFHQGGYINTITSANHFLSQKLNMLGQGLASTMHVPTAEGSSLVTTMIYGQVMKESAIQGINDAFIVATGLAILALILSFFIKRAVQTKPKPVKEAARKSGPPAAVEKNELATDQ